MRVTIDRVVAVRSAQDIKNLRGVRFTPEAEEDPRNDEQYRVACWCGREFMVIGRFMTIRADQVPLHDRFMDLAITFSRESGLEVCLHTSQRRFSEMMENPLVLPEEQETLALLQAVKPKPWSPNPRIRRPGTIQTKEVRINGSVAEIRLKGNWYRIQLDPDSS